MDLDTDQSWSFDPNSINVGLALIEEAFELWAHNGIKYDYPAIKKVYPWFNPRGRLMDSLVCTRLMFPEIGNDDWAKSQKGKFPAALIGSHSLEAWGHRLGVLKDTAGKTMDFKEWTPEMQAYCEQDVVVQKALVKFIQSQGIEWERAIEGEHQFARVIHRMTQYGVCFDTEAAAALSAKILGEIAAIDDQLQVSFPPKAVEYVTPKKGIKKIKMVSFNPNSRQQVAERLKELGWVPTKFSETGQVSIDDDVLENIKVPGAEPLARYFTLKKRIGQLATGNAAWMKLERNGRIHGDVNTNGAVTGRCTHSGPNTAQVPRVGSPFGLECRALFKPSKGRVLVGADASGLELRCLAHYLARWDGGRYATIVCSGDVHTENQLAFGLAPGKEGRNRAKTGIYALIYGAGNEKLGTSLERLEDTHEKLLREIQVPQWALRSMRKDGKITEDRLLNWKRGEYARLKIIRGIEGFEQLVNGVRDAVQARKYLIGIDGRKLHVRSAHSALNTLLQSAGALLVKRATVLWAEGVPEGTELLLHVHDEIQAEALPEHAEEVGKLFVSSIKQAGKDFNFRCPLSGEYKVGRNWAETH